MNNTPTITRRRFLQNSAALGALGFVLPNIIPASALGKDGKPPPSERIQVGLIGCNGMGLGNLGNCAKHPDVVVTAACDVWKKRAEAVAARHKDTCKVYTDFRELVQQKNVDAVINATPPHWHTLVAVAAVEAGKDLYLQKPMTLYLGEDIVIRNAVKRHKRICQVGTQIHASENYRRVVELIRGGYLGKVGCVRTFNVMNQGEQGVGCVKDHVVPEGLNWDFWCGPAPLIPYNSILATGSYHHGSWMAYSGGWTPGMAPHIIDLPIWALNLGYPIETSASGGRLIIKDDGDAYDNHEVLWRYPNCTVTWMSSLTNSYGFDLHGVPEPKRRLGIYFHGVKGTMYTDYVEHRIIPEGKAMNEFMLPEAIAKKQSKSFTGRALYYYKDLKPAENPIPSSPGHEREWLDCIKSRQQPSCSPQYHSHVNVPIVLSLLSLKLGRTIKCDPVTGNIVDDFQAWRLSVPQYRSPWKFPKQYLNA
jgi:predicted dehydrogenase